MPIEPYCKCTCTCNMIVCEKTSQNGQDEVNTTSDGKEQLSLPVHPEFIWPVNFAFLHDFWACQISYGKCPLNHIANARALAIWLYVKRHHQMDMMKSTQRVMERNNYHCSAILCSSGQSISHSCSIFIAWQIRDGTCPLNHIANAQWLCKSKKT